MHVRRQYLEDVRRQYLEEFTRVWNERMKTLVGRIMKLEDTYSHHYKGQVLQRRCIRRPWESHVVIGVGNRQGCSLVLERVRLMGTEGPNSLEGLLLFFCTNMCGQKGNVIEGGSIWNEICET